MKINQILNEYEYRPEEESKAVDQYNMLRRQVGEMYAEAFWRMWRKTGNVDAAVRMAQEEYDRMVQYESVNEDEESANYSIHIDGHMLKKERDFTAIDRKIWKLINGLEQYNNKVTLRKSRYKRIDPKNIILKRDGVEVDHKYVGGEKQPITGPIPQPEKVKEAMSDAYGVVPSEDKLEGHVEYKQHKNNDKGSVSVEASAETMDDLHDILKLAGIDMAMDLNKTERGHDHNEEPEEELIVQKDDEPCDVCGGHDCDGGSDEPEDKEVTVISPQDANYSTDKQMLVNFIKDKLKKSIS